MPSIYIPGFVPYQYIAECVFSDAIVRRFSFSSLVILYTYFKYHVCHSLKRFALPKIVFRMPSNSWWIFKECNFSVFSKSYSSLFSVINILPFYFPGTCLTLNVPPIIWFRENIYHKFSICVPFIILFSLRIEHSVLYFFHLHYSLCQLPLNIFSVIGGR